MRKARREAERVTEFLGPALAAVGGPALAGRVVVTVVMPRQLVAARRGSPDRAFEPRSDTTTDGQLDESGNPLKRPLKTVEVAEIGRSDGPAAPHVAR